MSMSKTLTSTLASSLHHALTDGRGGGFSIGSVFTPSSTGLWLDPSDLSTLSQTSGGTLGDVAASDPVGKAADKSGRGNTTTQATAGARPLLSVAGSVYSLDLDGTDDGLLSGAITLGADMDFFAAFYRDTTGAVLFGSQAFSSTPFFAAASSGSSSPASSGAGTPTYAVNGVAVPGGTATTRGQLNTALPPGSWLIVEAHNLNLSAWAAFVFGAYGGFPMNGRLGGLVLCPAQTDTVRGQIRASLGRKVGLVL